ncbi:MAG: hypothetical protein KKF62_05555 [Bacteroidetes bacterium]|nr:hypothetical protein [Bacteroidota bacterium]MBU1115731.1 hypothetical protein [Bacteroidota bacterium]MBU1799900.1 hypothetical protein [Bacteroidota bacterium]
MKKIFDVFIIFLLFLATTSSAQSGPYLGQIPPGPMPKLFVPNSLKSTSSWWWHGRLEFLSDGTEMFLDVYSQAEDKIRLRNIKLINGVWTAPASAPFSSPFSRDTDAAPSFFDNDNKVIFISDRTNGYSGNFWSSIKSGETWSDPQPVYVPWQQSLSSGWGDCMFKNKKGIHAAKLS